MCANVLHDARLSRLVSSAVGSKTSDEFVLADSPSLEMGLLMFDPGMSSDIAHQQRTSPLNRTLSNMVAPLAFGHDYASLFQFEFHTCPSNATDDISAKYHFDELISHF